MIVKTSGDFDEFYGVMYDKSGDLVAELYLVYGQITNVIISQAISPAKLKQFIYQVTKQPEAKGMTL